MTALILFSVVGDIQGLVSWAGNQRGSRLKEASPPALPKPGDPIIFFNITLKIPFIMYSTTLKLNIEPGFI